MPPTACFVTASNQNVFFGELVDAFAGALAAHGVAVERAVDLFPEQRDDLVYVFVPHELLPLLEADAHPSESQLKRSVAICTEQPGTSWFEEDSRIAARAGAVVDINQLGVAALARQGIRARRLQLGYVPAWDRWQGADDGHRPLELAFLGGVTPRRLTAIARCGSRLAGRRTELRLTESDLPHRVGSRHFVAGTEKWDLLAGTRLLLNVHRSELAYLEWQRAVEAMCNGCVLLSEASLGFEPLLPGEHFASVTFDSLPSSLDALLDDDARVAALRTAAYEFVRDELPLDRHITALAEAVQEAARAPVPATRRRPPAGPQPRPPASRPTEYARMLAERTELDIVRMALKQLLLDQREGNRKLRELERTLSGMHERHDTIERFGHQGALAPKVSVVITVFNYAALVGRAIESVVASDYGDYELVIVDDASTDGSGAAIRAALGELPLVPATLVTRARNGGLARARNIGVGIATGELVFMLDADNSIYPHALGRLATALDEMPETMFAYGVIEQFGADGPAGLMSYLGWDADRLRYGNFVDAMAMIRRTALLEVGGYVDHPSLYGWEDLALWCAFADRGWGGLRVPEIVARYRLGLHSMISLTNIDTSAAWSSLLERYACLSGERGG